jgi:SAM-dependent methyltransferase
MVAGGIVSVREGRYRLREAYRPLLAGTSASNVAPVLEMMLRLTEMAPEVAARFHDGCGIPARHYAARLDDHLVGPRQYLYAETFIEGFLGAVPGLHDRLQQGATVLDLGCGTGQTSRLIADAFPRVRVLGVDVVEEVIARARLEHAGVKGLEFAVGDAIDRHGQFDVILAVDVIHDLPDPAGALHAIRTSLDDGLFIMIDTSFSADIIDHVDDAVAAVAASTSVLYCLPVSLDHAGHGAGLGALWGHQRAEVMLRDAGFDCVDRYPAPRPQNTIYAASCRGHDRDHANIHGAVQ